MYDVNSTSMAAYGNEKTDSKNSALGGGLVRRHGAHQALALFVRAAVHDHAHPWLALGTDQRRGLWGDDTFLEPERTNAKTVLVGQRCKSAARTPLPPRAG